MPCGRCLGFFLGWMKAPGRGRALGVGEVKFTGMIVPTVKKLTYHVHLKRVILRKLVLGIADGCRARRRQADLRGHRPEGWPVPGRSRGSGSSGLTS